MNKIYKVILTVFSLITALMVLTSEMTNELRLLLTISVIVAIILTWLDHEFTNN